MLRRLLLVLIGSLCATCAFASTETRLDLTALEWRSAPGDDPARRAAGYDDSEWQIIDLSGPREAAVRTGKEGMVWFRVRIPADRIAKFARPAVFLGRISDADEAYLNGQLIGSTGTIYQTVWQYEGTGPTQFSRVYPIPVEALSGGSAVLALRVQSAQFAPGPERGPIILGELDELVTLARQRDIPVWLRDCLVLVVLFAGTCISLAGNARDAQPDRRSRWLPWFFASLLIGIFPSTLLAFESGLAKPGLAAVAELAPYVAFGALHFASSVGARVGKLQWISLGAIYAIAIGWIVANVSYDLFFSLSWMLVAPLVGVVAGSSLYQSYLAFTSGVRVSKWTYLAIVSIFLSIVLYAGWGKDFHPAADPVTIGICIMAFCLLLAQAEHATWDRVALQRVTGELLVAQDTERERLAKDLHDELSHRVAAIRLQLEALFYRPQAPEKQDLETPINELRETGMEISALVEGLRPATLDPLNFSDAVRQAVERWGQIGDMRVSLDIEDNLRLPEQKQVQLMRILQEALHNAVRHSQASEIKVGVSMNGRGGKLIVSDNGTGFDPGVPDYGLGLRTMRERAGLINADYNLESAPGRGTSIEVEFTGS